MNLHVKFHPSAMFRLAVGCGCIGRLPEAVGEGLEGRGGRLSVGLRAHSHEEGEYRV